MITSNSNPRVKQIVQWRNKAKERAGAGIFLTEGFKMFGEAPQELIREVYISVDILRREEPGWDIREKLDRSGYETVSEEVFRKMSDTLNPQGILCVMERPKYTLEGMLAEKTPLLVMLENLQDPGNLGTIVRTAEGAGATGIIMGSSTVDIYNPKTIRATMGSVFRVPFVYVQDLGRAAALLQEKQIRVYAAHLDGTKYYDDFSYEQGCAFLIGNEGNGLSRELADRADLYLKIPMEGSVESLNAAVTASILMYEAHRQRRRASHFQDFSS
ncbi:MAG: RNA methyltransferase [Lachnospiraceae bacterium]|jgi:TrmH family RNA methyltransferase|nr:RNA methyltransferase [Lachnospiraceae bacterium]